MIWRTAKEVFRRAYVEGRITSTVRLLRKQMPKLDGFDADFVAVAMTALDAAGSWLNGDEAEAIRSTVHLRDYADAMLVKLRRGVKVGEE